MGILQQLRREGSLILHHDYRAGHARDLRGSYHGTVSATAGFNRRGLRGGTTIQPVVVADALPLRLLAGGSLVVLLPVGWRVPGSQTNILVKQDAGGTAWTFYAVEPGAFWLDDGTVTRSAACGSVENTRYCGVSWLGPGTVPVAYTDYLGFVGVAFSGAWTPASNDAPLVIGSSFAAGDLCRSCSVVALISRALTSTEHATLYQELVDTQWPTSTRRTMVQQGQTDNSAGRIAQWNPGDLVGTVLPDQSGAGNTGTIQGDGGLSVVNSDLGPVLQVEGTRVADCGAFASAKGAAALTVALWARRAAVTTGGFSAGFFSAANQRLGLGASGTDWYWFVATGDNSYGQYTLNDLLWHHLVLRFDGTQVTNATRLRGWVDGQEVTLNYTLNIPATTTVAATNWQLGGLAGLGNTSGQAGPCSVWSRALSPAEITREYQVAKVALAQNDWGTQAPGLVRGGTVGAYLEATDWQFSDSVVRCSVGTAVLGGKTVKTVTYTTGGAEAAVYRSASQLNQSAQEAAYGTWEISFYSPAGAPLAYHFCSSLPYCTAPGGNNGYALLIGGGVYAIYRYTGGVVAVAIIETNAAFLANSTWYRTRINRTRLGLWSAWVKGGAHQGWTPVPLTGPSGPFINPDNTYTVAPFQVMNAMTNAVVALGAVDGTGAISKALF
jgi:hypothetical protein